MTDNEQFEAEVKKYLKKQTNPVVKIKLLDPRAEIPRYETEGSAGFDLKTLNSETILPFETKLIKTGISMEIPIGWELQIRPRSGTSLKTKLRVANSPGTVDSDYRGGLMIIIENTYKYPININSGDRIAQGILARAPQAIFELIETLSITARGSGGFGSTGK
jgi:dUTP pyrophosphatase